MTLYFAYGSNLNLLQMEERCPAAEPLDKLYLPDARLVFRGVADVEFVQGETCPGGLWRLTPACEAALDRYEGCTRDGRGLYRKVRIAVDDLPDDETHVMMYVMNSTGIMPPSARYYRVIADGYDDFGLRLRELRFALKHAHDAKHLTHVERKRLRRTGRPPVKARPVPKGAKAPVVAKARPPVVAIPPDLLSADWAPMPARTAAKRQPTPASLPRPLPPPPAAKRAKGQCKLADWLDQQRQWGRRT
jgi:hypothetical protein